MQVTSGLSIITENNILHNETRFFQQLITRQQRIQNKKIMATYDLVAILIPNGRGNDMKKKGIRHRYILCYLK